MHFFRPAACMLLMILLAFAFSPKTQAASRFYAKVKRVKYLQGEKSTIVTKGKNIRYKFKSSNKEVARVSKDGVITAVSKGKAVIRIKGIKTIDDKKQVVGIKEVKIRVYACRLKKDSLTIDQGSVYDHITIKGKKLNRKVRFESLNSAVASVNPAGVVRGVREGSTQIVVHIGQYVQLPCDVTVRVKTLSSSYQTLLVNRTHRYGTLNLKESFLNAANMGNVPVAYEVRTMALGGMNGDLYHADSVGTARVTVYGGPYKQEYYIRQISWQAHRGYLDIRPENTLDAFEAAAIHGANRIETDLRVTMDGELVLLHDSKVGSMTDGSGKVSAMTLEEIRALQIDNGNGLELCNAKRIPLLKEYLAICRRYNVIANIELKSLGTTDEQRAESARKIFQELQHAGMLQQAFVTSSSAALLKIFREEAGDQIPIGGLTVTCRNNLRSWGISVNTSTGTIFGTHSTLNYSPVIGKLGLDPKVYRIRQDTDPEETDPEETDPEETDPIETDPIESGPEEP